MKQLLFIFTLLLNITISTTSNAQAGFNQLKTLPPTNTCPPCNLQVRGSLTKVTHPIEEAIQMKLVAFNEFGVKMVFELNAGEEFTVLNKPIFAARAFIVARVMGDSGIETIRYRIPKENISGSANPGGDDI